MKRSISLTFSLGGATALALVTTPLLPATAQNTDSAEDLGGALTISLNDVVKPTFGFQGALQGASTPNQAGIGGFLPLSVGENGVWYLDALVNVSFSDRDGESSIINTDVDGGISTSTRLGYRWLNEDRSWMYGLNAGYDSRTVEFAETFQIPSVDVFGDKPFRLEEYWDQALFDRFNAAYSRTYGAMSAFLSENKVDHKMAKAAAAASSAPPAPEPERKVA